MTGFKCVHKGTKKTGNCEMYCTGATNSCGIYSPKNGTSPFNGFGRKTVEEILSQNTPKEEKDDVIRIEGMEITI